MGIKPRAWIEWFRASTASRLKAMTAPNVEPEPILFIVGQVHDLRPVIG
jgi:hypothetical protein